MIVQTIEHIIVHILVHIILHIIVHIIVHITIHILVHIIIHIIVNIIIVHIIVYQAEFSIYPRLLLKLHIMYVQNLAKKCQGAGEKIKKLEEKHQEIETKTLHTKLFCLARKAHKKISSPPPLSKFGHIYCSKCTKSRMKGN